MCPGMDAKTGFVNIKVRSFAADIQGPFTEQNKADIAAIINMFWAPRVEAEVSKETWENFKRISNPASEKCILNNDNYTGMLTYTMYSGVVDN